MMTSRKKQQLGAAGIIGWFTLIGKGWPSLVVEGGMVEDLDPLKAEYRTIRLYILMGRATAEMVKKLAGSNVKLSVPPYLVELSKKFAERGVPCLAEQTDFLSL